LVDSKATTVVQRQVIDVACCCTSVVAGWVAGFATFHTSAGVLAGAIDYYILDKYQRLAKTKAYDEVSPAFGVAG